MKDSILSDIRSLLMEVMGTNNSNDGHAPVTSNLRHKPAPVEFGRFRGENAEAWIFQAERYFDFYKIAEDQHLSLASFYLYIDVLEWYRWLFRNMQHVDWEHLAAKVRIRYHQKGLESAVGRLTKLWKTTTVLDFQTRF